MHVAFVVFGTLTDRSGGFRYDDHLRRAFERRGHTVSIVSQDEPQGYREQYRLGREARWVSEAASLAPDLILIDELNHAATLPGIATLRAPRRNTPILAIVHHLRSDERPFRLRSRRTERRFLQAVDGWICNSTATLARVRRVSGVRRSSAVVFPAAISDADERYTDVPIGEGRRRPDNRSPLRSGEVRVIAVGNVIPRKNVHLVVDAVRRREDARFDAYGDVTGDPKYTRRVERSIGAAGERIQLHGRVSPEEINASFQDADILAVPSSYEGFGIVYLEALRRGIPVIATRRGGARDIVVSDRVGRLVPPRRSAVRRALDEMIVELRSESQSVGESPGIAGETSSIATEARRVASLFPSWEVGMAGAVRFAETITRRFGTR